MSRRRELHASPGRIVLALLGLGLAASLLLAAVGAVDRRGVRQARSAGRELAASLHLTDLTLWSAASYCRHPSQADLFSSHGEHPAAPDHFPAGSLIPPPSPDRLRIGSPPAEAER